MKKPEKIKDVTVGTKDKVIQAITAWVYPCDNRTEAVCYKKDFFVESQYFTPLREENGKIVNDGSDIWDLDKRHYVLNKKLLLYDDWKRACPCGKGCKPQRVKIIVAEV